MRKQQKNTIGISVFLFFFISAKGQDNLKLSEHVKAALVAHNQDSVEILSKQLLQKSPSSRNYLLAGIAAEQENKNEHADQLYQQALTTANDTERYRIMNAIGYMHFKRGDTAEAIHQHMSSLRLNSGQPEVHYFMATIYRFKRNTDSLEYHAAYAYQLDSSRVEYIRLMANTAYEKGDLINAIRYLNRLNKVKKVSNDADSNKTKEMLATAYMDVDNYKAALPLLKELVTDSADNDIYFFQMAECYKNLNNYREALQMISKAITLCKTTKQENYDLQISLYQVLGQQNNVLETYVAGRKRGLKTYAAWLNEFKTITGEVKEIYGRLSLESRDKQRTDLRTLAKIYLFAKDDNSAIHVLNDYRKLNGQLDDSVMAMYATAYEGLNKLPEAKSAILEAIKGSPEDKTYESLLLSILYKQRDYREVANLIQKNATRDAFVAGALRRTLLFKSYTMLGETKMAIKNRRIENE